MSFHEKSAWACLISISVVYVPYLLFVFRFPMAALGLFWVSAIALVALLVVFHITNAIATRSIRTTGEVPPIDELDQQIDLNAAKWAGLILSFAVITWILVTMYLIPMIASSMPAQAQPTPAIPMFTAMAAVHWLFACFVLANLAYYGGIVFRYRRLASA
jgi:hypothetical protein